MALRSPPPVTPVPGISSGVTFVRPLSLPQPLFKSPRSALLADRRPSGSSLRQGMSPFLSPARSTISESPNERGNLTMGLGTPRMGVLQSGPTVLLDHTSRVPTPANGGSASISPVLKPIPASRFFSHSSLARKSTSGTRQQEAAARMRRSPGQQKHPSPRVFQTTTTPEVTHGLGDVTDAITHAISPESQDALEQRTPESQGAVEQHTPESQDAVVHHTPESVVQSQGTVDEAALVPRPAPVSRRLSFSSDSDPLDFVITPTKAKRTVSLPTAPAAKRIKPSMPEARPGPSMGSRRIGWELASDDSTPEASITCSDCGMVYSPGSPADVRRHARHHATHDEGVEWIAVKKWLSLCPPEARSAHSKSSPGQVGPVTPSGSRIVAVNSASSAPLQRKARRSHSSTQGLHPTSHSSTQGLHPTPTQASEVLAIVYSDLGSPDQRSLVDLSTQQIFLCVSASNRVVGAVVAEPLMQARKVVVGGGTCALCAIPRHVPPHKPYIPRPIPPHKPYIPRPDRTGGAVLAGLDVHECRLGVAHMWVLVGARRHGVCTDMMDAVRHHFHYGHVVPRHLVAFSHPTPDGRRFAEDYTGNESFLVF